MVGPPILYPSPRSVCCAALLFGLRFRPIIGERSVPDLIVRVWSALTERVGHAAMSSQQTIPRGERLRRVLILCQAIARNLAYYRVGWREEYKDISDYSKHPQSANFWRTANSNFIDMCVLEWCKLFADKNGKHFWGNIVSNSAAFKTALLAHLGIDDAAFGKEIEAMLRYRDKFLGHLDSDVVMNIPGLEIGKRAA